MIAQREKWDCGHACLAYVLGKSLDDVLAFMPLRELTDWEIGWALKIHRRNQPGHVTRMTSLGTRIVNVNGKHWVVMKDDEILCPANKEWSLSADTEGILVKPLESSVESK